MRRFFAGLLVVFLAGCGAGSDAPLPAATAKSNPSSAVPPSVASSPTVRPSAAGGVPEVVPNNAAANNASNEASAPASQTSAPPAPAAPGGPNPLVAQINDLKSRRARSRDEHVQNHSQLYDLGNKLLAEASTPAERATARESALQGIDGITLVDGKRRDLLEPLDKLSADVLAESADGPAAAAAMYFHASGHLNIERDGSESDPSINKRILELAKAFATKFPTDQRAAVLLYRIGENANMDGQFETMKETFALLVKTAPVHPLAQQAAALMRKAELVGTVPEISGPGLDGSIVDLKQFAGKVVLVDFWATWCGPCIGELPNVQSVYAKFHEKGFEVLAISLDNTKDALTGFVAQRQLPWPQIFFDEEGKRGWANPLGRKYGINSIPATFLVGRDGKVRKLDVRGPALEPAVAELLNETAPAAF